METSYPAHDNAATLALAHHVPRAFPNASARQLARGVLMVVEGCAVLFVAAVQRMLLQLVAVFEQIGAELSAGARQMMQRVEVELAGKLSDYAASLNNVVSMHRGVESSPCCRFRLTDNSSGRR